MKVKVHLTIKTGLNHNDDTHCGYSPNRFSTRETVQDIEIEIPDDMVKIFNELWGKNQLVIDINGSKTFKDGEEIV